MPVFKGRLQVYRVCRHGNYLEKKQAILYPSEPQVLRVADNEAWVVQMLFVVVKSFGASLGGLCTEEGEVTLLVRQGD